MGRHGKILATQDMIDGLEDERNGIQSLNYEDFDDIIERLRKADRLENIRIIESE